MRLLLILCGLLGSAAVNAATVTLDFEEVPLNSSFPLQSKGYTFTGSGAYLNEPYFYTGPDGIRVGGTGTLFGPPPELTLNMVRTDGGIFAIYSAEVLYSTGSIGGLTGEGNSADLSVAIGTGDWLNLRSLYLSSIPGNVLVQVALDDLVVSATAVPVPAALWMFGSALGILGWQRRKRNL